MSWIKKGRRSWLENFCINVLKQGVIPKHVAIIMDGNRRYAAKVGVEKDQGHALGFEKLSETLDWCLDLGITEVTIYTFSIENFKRPKEEVDCLMNLAREKFKELLQEKQKLDEYEVCIRIYGDITLLPVDLQMLVAEASLYTYNNKKTFLNICLAYTAREEITEAAREIAKQVVAGCLQKCDITENLVTNSLYSNKSPPPDILVRTSGEVRLSDFLLWQSSYSVLAFIKVLWPEFTIWHLFAVVLFYQHNYPGLKKIEQRHNKERQEQEEKRITALLRSKISMSDCTEDDDGGLEAEISRQSSLMEVRRKNFLNHLDNERYRRLVLIKSGKTVQNQPHLS